MRKAILTIAMMFLLFISSCATPSKALIDYTMTEGIVWPGEPEKPRIKYLWSLQKVMGAEGVSKYLRLIAGEVDYDIEDPRNSDMLVNPYGIFVDSKDTMYIADPGGSRVCIIDLITMKSTFIFEMGKEYLMSPIGVAVDEKLGRIYISDSDLGKVGIYSAKGNFLKHFEGGFKRPTGIAMSLDGFIYVVDTWEHIVYKYDFEGKRLGSFGKEGDAPGEFNYATHVAVDGNGYIYVSDSLNFRVQIFTPSGELLNTFGLIGTSYGMFDKIKGIAIDTEGHIYIVDSAKDMIQIYDKEGRLLLFFGHQGSFYGDFFLPTGIFIDRKNRVFVSDSFNMRVQAFQFLGGDK